MCGTVYGDIHYKDLLGSITEVGYRIPVPDFYLVLHGLRCRKKHSRSDGLFNQSIKYGSLVVFSGSVQILEIKMGINIVTSRYMQ